MNHYNSSTHSAIHRLRVRLMDADAETDQTAVSLRLSHLFGALDILEQREIWGAQLRQHSNRSHSSTVSDDSEEDMERQSEREAMSSSSGEPCKRAKKRRRRGRSSPAAAESFSADRAWDLPGRAQMRLYKYINRTIYDSNSCNNNSCSKVLVVVQ